MLGVGLSAGVRRLDPVFVGVAGMMVLVGERLVLVIGVVYSRVCGSRGSVKSGLKSVGGGGYEILVRCA